MNQGTSRRTWLLSTLAVPILHRVAPVRAAQTEWTLAVVPQFPATKLHQDWKPLVDHIERISGIRLVLKLAPDIPRFEAEVLSGAVDFAYLNPYHQVMAQREQGFVPLVRDARKLSGILVVRRDGPISTLGGLDGQALAFPAPNAFGASLWMRALLAEQQRIRFQARYVQTHSNVYRQVIAGRVAAGGGILKTLSSESEDVRAALRVLFETPGAAPHPLSAHPRVPVTVREAVTQAVLGMPADVHGRALLEGIAWQQPVRADQKTDYEPLARFKLERYVVMPVAAG